MPLVSEHDVRRAAARGRRTLEVEPDAVVTPQALDIADRLGLRVVRGKPQEPVVPGVDASRAISRTLLRRASSPASPWLARAWWGPRPRT